MKAKLAVATATLILLAGCQQEPQGQPSNNRVGKAICDSQASMPGGWHDAEVDHQVMQAVDTVLEQMNTNSPLKGITSVHTQVVSGVNYAIEFQLENGSQWNTIVYRNLKGEYQITQTAKLGLFCQQ
ncbi:TPA: pyruvate dehydrogenase [Vibrio vulnificus]|uniref:Pyruvate dehydrogenase n=1 Tax=Vibrio vulnificus TaxID=672 RepID=A0ABX4X2M7_VIBVL|nr:cystatin domain-containing protein [Vibrio vulnificus]EGQ7934703.1 pyruvate dehydrogenase [Vibrio vulnificus]EGQ9302140.1 pyruvate dehydrogenase [Vibrio vulnificus]EGQ9992844.1 pyruvate dehydrogenase [Vibrio vulnificus]EGR0062213.1 pyruvate dehydrogenase [Vibrio vulnificus]EGR0071015.1 pyruvate dehydrogenase [Vibrio vulnificus]